MTPKPYSSLNSPERRQPFLHKCYELTGKAESSAFDALVHEVLVLLPDDALFCVLTKDRVCAWKACQGIGFFGLSSYNEISFRLSTRFWHQYREQVAKRWSGQGRIQLPEESY